MKRYGILFALVALVLASLACQTLSGGDSGDSSSPSSPPSSDSGEDSQEAPDEQPPAAPDNSDKVDVQGEFPMPDGATNVMDINGTTNFQVKMDLRDAANFYLEELANQGYKEDKLLTVIEDAGFSMVFDGHASGKAIVVQGVDMGDGTVNINIRLEEK